VKTGRILVVDDQVELAENIAEVLQGLGFETEVAASAETGLERIRQGGITALITDFRLPGRSGADLIGEIRRAGESIPALVMSAYTDDQTIDESQAAGAWLFLPKPVPLPVLIDVFGSLTAAGHEVIVSRTAAEALSQRRRLHTAVVDYRLPDGTGIDVARKLRARDPAVRILFISGHTDELRACLAKELSEADTMEKPLDTGTVVSWIALGSRKTT
jgi:two-component system chemotaxis response regulator CheY